MNANIRLAREEDIPYWLEMRNQLWEPDHEDDFFKEVQTIISASNQTAFIAQVDSHYAGFIEISIRDYADGCKTSNVGYIEGIYVKPEFRRRGISLLLLSMSEEWFVSQGCTEMASDAEMDNEISIEMHKAMGFRTLKPVIQFAKILKSRG